MVCVGGSFGPVGSPGWRRREVRVDDELKRREERRDVDWRTVKAVKCARVSEDDMMVAEGGTSMHHGVLLQHLFSLARGGQRGCMGSFYSASLPSSATREGTAYLVATACFMFPLFDFYSSRSI